MTESGKFNSTDIAKTIRPCQFTKEIASLINWNKTAFIVCFRHATCWNIKENANMLYFVVVLKPYKTVNRIRMYQKVNRSLLVKDFLFFVKTDFIIA